MAGFSDDNGAEMKAWVREQLMDDAALVVFAKVLVHESWSAGIGGPESLGDRVYRRRLKSQITENFELFDPALFRRELERLLDEKRRPQEDLDAVKIFLEARSVNDRNHEDDD